jgi:hypothetical protein
VGQPSVILSVLASVVVVIVHHLGYREFRGRAARTKLVGAVVACGAQALALSLIACQRFRLTQQCVGQIDNALNAISIGSLSKFQTHHSVRH